MSAFWTAFLAVLMALEAPKTPEQAVRAAEREGAVGPYQIRKVYLVDVNAKRRDDVFTKFRGPLRLGMMVDKATAEWTVLKYMEIYGPVAERKAKRDLTAEDYARMHNGGPNGWKSDATKSYLKRWREECAARGLDPKTLKPIDGGAK